LPENAEAGERFYTKSPIVYEDEGCAFSLDCIRLITKVPVPNRGGLSITVFLDTPGDRFEMNGADAEALLQALRDHMTVETPVGEAQAFWEDALTFLPLTGVKLIQKTANDLRLRGFPIGVAIPAQSATEFLARWKTFLLCANLKEETDA